MNDSRAERPGPAIMATILASLALGAVVLAGAVVALALAVTGSV